MTVVETATCGYHSSPKWGTFFQAHSGMKQFFFAVALTFALAAGAVTVFTVQLTLAAAQTFTFGVGTLTGLTVQPQLAKACPSTSGCRQR
jgi:hypothetical protein